MSSETDIANLALINVGSTQMLTTLATDTSNEAVVIRKVFNTCRDEVLEDFPWPFARGYADLTLAYGESGDPTNGDWTFAYRLPTDCLKVRRIVTDGGRTDTTLPPFAMGRDALFDDAATWSGATAYVEGDLALKTGVVYQAIADNTNHTPPNATYWVVVSDARLMFTDEPDVSIEYTVGVTDATQFSAMFVSCLSWKIAAKIAPALSRIVDMAKAAMGMFETEKSKAQRSALNEAQQDPPPEAEWIDAR